MDRLAITLIISVILVALALVGLSIGLILTGKVRLRFCGRHPLQKRDEKCGKTTHCPICDHDKESDKQD